MIHRNSICVKDSSNLSPHRPAVTSGLILWNSRPVFQQCIPQLLRSLWGLHVVECACLGNPTLFRCDSGQDWRQAMVTRQRRSPSGNGFIHKPHEDGRYHTVIVLNISNVFSFKRVANIQNTFKSFKRVANIQNTLLMFQTRCEYSKHVANVSNALPIFATRLKHVKRIFKTRC